MKSECQQGYYIGFGTGQDDQKAKQKTNDVPTVSANTQALADTGPQPKTPGNDTTQVSTATDMSSTPNDTTSLPPPFTSSHDDVQQQLEDARLEGWETGLVEGQKMEKRKGEDCKKKSEEKVTEKGVQVGRDEEDQWQNAEGHGKGLCLSIAAHTSTPCSTPPLTSQVTYT